MQYKIVCNSPLLEYTLEYFLKDHLSEKGIVITDNPEINGILIGKDIKKPFTKTSLYIQLEKHLPIKKKIPIEKKIDMAIEKFKEELLNILKEYDGKE
jgi:Mg2+/Co2+ transporter CorC